MPSPSPFYAEIMEQASTLERLVDAYAAPELRQRLARTPAGPRPALVGMGASFHSAEIMAQQANRMGVPARAFEASEALYAGDGAALAQAAPLVYISQSGASGEIEPLLAGLPAPVQLIGVTNHLDSPLARGAAVVLPLLAGEEKTVAAKTYLNSLAVLWLLARHWAGTLDDSAFTALRGAAGRMGGLLAEGPAVADQWLAALEPAQTLVFVGAGPQAVTARQSAMMVMEWLKVPALSFSLGAFRHGPIEIAQPGLGVVVFAAPGPAYASSHRLAQELAGYGAAVLLVENGATRTTGAPGPARTAGGPAGEGSADGRDLADGLAPLLDVVPVQLFVEALARRRGLAPRFRHIQKVVTET